MDCFFERETLRSTVFKDLEGDQNLADYRGIYLGFSIMNTVGAITGIILFGLQLGSRSTYVFLVGCILSNVLDIVFFQPLYIWFRFVFMYSFSRMYLASLLYILRHRAKAILSRTRGFMDNARCFVQRVNPGCRAARAFPSLPVSRLLLSLGDHDLPVTRYHLLRNPVFYRILRNGYLAIYRCLSFLRFLPSLARTVLLNIALVVASFAVLYQFLSPSIVLVDVIVSTLVFCLVIFVLPVLLLNCETTLEKDDSSEDTRVVLRVLRKKTVKLNRSKRFFSAFNPEGMVSVTNYDGASSGDESVAVRNAQTQGERYRPVLESAPFSLALKTVHEEVFPRAGSPFVPIDLSPTKKSPSVKVTEFDEEFNGETEETFTPSPATAARKKPSSSVSPKMHLFKLVNVSRQTNRNKRRLKDNYNMNFPGRKSYLQESELSKEKLRAVKETRLKIHVSKNSHRQEPRSYDRGPGFSSLRAVDNFQVCHINFSLTKKYQ